MTKAWAEQKAMFSPLPLCCYFVRCHAGTCVSHRVKELATMSFTSRPNKVLSWQFCGIYVLPWWQGHLLHLAGIVQRRRRKHISSTLKLAVECQIVASHFVGSSLIFMQSYHSNLSLWGIHKQWGLELLLWPLIASYGTFYDDNDLPHSSCYSYILACHHFFW